MDTAIGAVNTVGTEVSVLRGRIEALPTAVQFGAIRNDLGRLDGRVSELPTWKAMVATILLLGAVTGGLATVLAELARLGASAWIESQIEAIEPHDPSGSRPNAP